MMRNELVDIVGNDWVHRGDATAEYAVDGVAPKMVAFPGTVDELADVLRRAGEANWTVVPAGYGTGLELGNLMKEIDLVISTTRLDRVIDYEPADLTASIQSGCSLHAFNQIVKRQGQWLPLDPPRPERATLGAVAAMNGFGPLRLGFGLIRDYVIGLQIVTADGERIKTGGKVVKNVAGYELNKLFVGSFGTLGVMARLNLKLRPRPESEATCLLSGRDVAALDEAAKMIAASELSPVALELIAHRTAQHLELPCPSGHGVLLLRFMELEPAVRYQVERLKDIAHRNRLEMEELEETSTERLWASVCDFSANPRASVMLRANVRPSDALETLRLLESGFLDFTDDVDLLAHHRHGVIWAHTSSQITDAQCERLAERARSWRGHCQQLGGTLIIHRAPRALKQRLDVWGEVGPTANMMRALKQQFDPRGILNPGRFAAGI